MDEITAEKFIEQINKYSQFDQKYFNQLFSFTLEEAKKDKALYSSTSGTTKESEEDYAKLA